MCRHMIHTYFIVSFHMGSLYRVHWTSPGLYVKGCTSLLIGTCIHVRMYIHAYMYVTYVHIPYYTARIAWTYMYVRTYTLSYSTYCMDIHVCTYIYLIIQHVLHGHTCMYVHIPYHTARIAWTYMYVRTYTLSYSTYCTIFDSSDLRFSLCGDL